MSEKIEAVFYPSRDTVGHWRELANVHGVFHGLNGLWMEAEERPTSEGAAQVMREYLTGKVPDDVVQSVTAEWFNPNPWVQVSEGELSCLMTAREAHA